MDAERREYLEMQLSAYLDGELTPEERAEVEAWLASDPTARSLASQLRATIGVVQGLPRARASEELLGDLRTRLERKALLETAPPTELATGTSMRSWSRWVAVAAVVALTFTAGYFSWTLRQDAGSPAGPQYAMEEKTQPSPSRELLQDLKDKAVPEAMASRSDRSEKIPARETPSLAPAAPSSPAARPSPKVEATKLASAERRRGAMENEMVSQEAIAKTATLQLGTDFDEAAATFDSLASSDYRKGVSAGSIDASQPALTPATADGQTSVLTMKFADAHSREKVIDLLRREVELETSQNNSFAMGDATVGAARIEAAGAPVIPDQAADKFVNAPGSLAGETQPGSGGIVDHIFKILRAGGGKPAEAPVRGTVMRISSIEGDASSRVNTVEIVAPDRAAADRIVAVLNEGGRAGDAVVVANQPAGGGFGYSAKEVKDSSTLYERRIPTTGAGGGADRGPAAPGNRGVAPREDEDGDGVSDTRLVERDKEKFSQASPSSSAGGRRLSLPQRQRPEATSRGSDAVGTQFGTFAGSTTSGPHSQPASSSLVVARGNEEVGRPIEPSGGFGGMGGPSAVRAGSNPAAASPATRPVGSSPSTSVGDSLLVVFLNVVPPEARPSTRPASTTPVAAMPATQPASKQAP